MNKILVQICSPDAAIYQFCSPVDATDMSILLAIGKCEPSVTLHNESHVGKIKYGFNAVADPRDGGGLGGGV